MKCLIFDAEGVIIDTEPLWDRSQAVLLREYGMEYDRQEIKRLLAGNSFIDGTKILMKYCDATESFDFFLNKRKEIIWGLFNERIKFVEGFESFYFIVKDKFNLCIATSLNRELLSLAIDKLKLRSYFDNIFSIEDIKCPPKPDPSIFLYAADKLNCDVKDCIVIEDSPKGISAAKDAGMYCIGITTTFPKKEISRADLIVNSFYEIDIEGLLR